MLQDKTGTLKRRSTAATDRGQERALSILTTARAMVTENGLATLSMRSIAVRVGISLGNLQHYYATKEELLEALLAAMVDGWQVDIAQVLTANESAEPAARFAAVVGMLWERVQEPRTANVLLDIWALSSRDPFAAGLVDRLRSREHKAMSQLLRDLAGNESPRNLELRASMIVLVIEGLIVQLARTGLKPAARRALAGAAMRTVMELAAATGEI